MNIMTIKNFPQKHLSGRRRALKLIGGAGATLLAFDSEGFAPSTGANCSTTTPQGTEGPLWVEEKLFPPHHPPEPVTGVVRTGIPLALTITVVNSNSSCAALTGAYVDIWHCDAKGLYSDEGTYNPGGGVGNVNTQGQKFLRGYQITDSNGQVQFTTI